MRHDLPKGVLFDLGDTILTTTGAFDPQMGNEHLLKIAENPREISVEEITESVMKLTQEIFALKEKSCIEFSCLSFQKILYELMDITFSLPPDELELEFWKGSVNFTPEEGIEDVLDALERENIPLGVVSNSAFSQKTLSYELDKHDLLDKFDFVMSSADYGFRKPHSMIFKAAVKKLGVNPHKIWFVGNSFKHDVKGAIDSGLNAIWYNRVDETPPDGETNFIEIKSWNQLLEKINTG
jgi:putative hydrolase of the HAD superfamily